MAEKSGSGGLSGQRKSALITGASAGIGAALARQFAVHDCDLLLVARRLERLVALKTELESRYGVAVHAYQRDLSLEGAAYRLFADIEREGRRVDILVNNAGFGMRKGFEGSPWEAHRAFLQVLVVSVAELCHLFVPKMKAQRYGRILNVASLAALAPVFRGVGMYPAAKAFVVRLSETLALEGAPYGVHVTALCPGYTRTEFHDVADLSDFAAMIPGRMWMTAEEVARQGYEAVMSGKTIYVNGRMNRAIAALSRMFPNTTRRLTPIFFPAAARFGASLTE